MNEQQINREGKAAAEATRAALNAAGNAAVGSAFLAYAAGINYQYEIQSIDWALYAGYGFLTYDPKKRDMMSGGKSTISRHSAFANI
jgi:hypothetical protein